MNYPERQNSSLNYLILKKRIFSDEKVGCDRFQKNFLHAMKS